MRWGGVGWRAVDLGKDKVRTLPAIIKKHAAGCRHGSHRSSQQSKATYAEQPPQWHAENVALRQKHWQRHSYLVWHLAGQTANGACCLPGENWLLSSIALELLYSCGHSTCGRHVPMHPRPSNQNNKVMCSGVQHAPADNPPYIGIAACSTLPASQNLVSNCIRSRLT